MMKGKFTVWLVKNSLLIGTIVGVIVGVGLGFSLRTVNISDQWQQVIAYPGELFTRALQMMILPLIITSLVVGSASLNAKLNGKITVRTLGYFVITSLLNSIIGVVLAIAFHPGDEINFDSQQGYELEERKNTLLDNILDLGRNIVPNNVFEALFQQTQTVYESVKNGSSLQENGIEYQRNVVVRDGTNSLGIITFSLIFGTVLGTLGERSKLVLEGFKAIDEVIMIIIRGIMWITPLGVASIISSKIISVDNIATITAQLGLFVVTVCVGVLFYQLIILQFIYFLIKRENPFRFYAGLMHATITAFSTASAAVALPITFRCMDNLKVDSRISHFVLPIGVSVNKDGTALFVPIASIFIAQMNGITLSFGDFATVAITSTAVSIAAASIPSAALALMFIVLNAINVPTKDIGLLFAVDWLVDRVRTTNNLLGDCYATVFVEHFSQKELREMDLKPHENTNRAGSLEDKILDTEEDPSDV